MFADAQLRVPGQPAGRRRTRSSPSGASSSRTTSTWPPPASSRPPPPSSPTALATSEPPALSPRRPARLRGVGRPRAVARAWRTAALAVAAVVAAPDPGRPVLARSRPPATCGCTSGAPSSSSWRCNTLALLAGVGRGHRWWSAPCSPGSWSHYRFPGRGIFEWALILPLAMPAYVDRLHLPRALRVLGARSRPRCAAGSARAFACPSSARGAASPLMMTLVFYPYVYLLARAAFREQGSATLETARSLGRSRARAFLRGDPAAGAALSRRRRGAGHDGGPRRLRHRGDLRLPHAHRGRSTASGTACSIASAAAPARRACSLLFAPALLRDRARLAGPAAVQSSATAAGPRPRPSSCTAGAPPRPPSPPAPACSASPSSCRSASSSLWAARALGRRAGSPPTFGALLANTSGSPPSPPVATCLPRDRARLRGPAAPLARPRRFSSRLRVAWATRCPARSSRWAS